MHSTAVLPRWSLVMLVLCGLLGFQASAAAPAGPPEDEAYFLSFRQKGQLIWQGCIQDSAGRWYDVWICPGYTEPTSYGWEHIQKSGRHFHRYLEAEKYKTLAERSGDCFTWAYKDCGRDFMVKGIPKAWSRYMNQAAARTQRREFGSILAYPWATMEGVFNTTVRLVGGLGGVTLGTASGALLVPVWHALDSGVAGTVVFVGQGVVLPVSGYAWNTLASPTLAMIGGPRPAPSRADGFWVRLLDEQGRDRAGLRPEELSAAVAWGVLLLTEVQPGLDRGDALKQETDQKIAALRQELAREQQRLRDDADRRAAQFREEAGHPAAPPALLKRYAEQIAQALRRDPTLSEPDVRKILELIQRYPPPLPPPPPAKTDPVRRGLDILQDVSR